MKNSYNLIIRGKKEKKIKMRKYLNGHYTKIDTWVVNKHMEAYPPTIIIHLGKGKLCPWWTTVYIPSKMAN